jgi:hypothetical protein
MLVRTHPQVPTGYVEWKRGLRPRILRGNPHGRLYLRLIVLQTKFVRDMRDSVPRGVITEQAFSVDHVVTRRLVVPRRVEVADSLQTISLVGELVDSLVIHMDAPIFVVVYCLEKRSTALERMGALISNPFQLISIDVDCFSFHSGAFFT